MIRLLFEAGPLIWPIFLLVLVIGLLVMWSLLSLALRREVSAHRHRQAIDAILFWGGVAAMIGFLGQWIGIHRLTRAVADRGIVSPEAVAYGISESLLTPIAGMTVLIGAAFVWFLLRLGLWTMKREADAGAD